MQTRWRHSSVRTSQENQNQGRTLVSPKEAPRQPDRRIRGRCSSPMAIQGSDRQVFSVQTDQRFHRCSTHSHHPDSVSSSDAPYRRLKWVTRQLDAVRFPGVNIDYIRIRGGRRHEETSLFADFMASLPIIGTNRTQVPLRFTVTATELPRRCTMSMCIRLHWRYDDHENGRSWKLKEGFVQTRLYLDVDGEETVWQWMTYTDFSVFYDVRGRSWYLRYLVVFKILRYLIFGFTFDLVDDTIWMI